MKFLCALALSLSILGPSLVHSDHFPKLVWRGHEIVLTCEKIEHAQEVLLSMQMAMQMGSSDDCEYEEISSCIAEVYLFIQASELLEALAEAKKDICREA